MAKNIVIVDDEADIRELVSDILKDEGYNPYVAGNSSDAIAMVDASQPAAVVLDIWLQGSELDGLGILEVLKRKYPFLPVIMMSGHGTIETAVNAIKLGAYDYVEKPFNEDRLLLVVKHAIETATLKKQNIELKQHISLDAELIGNSPAINQLRAAIDRVAPASSRVMVTGPAGAGKEFAARLIHSKSKRAEQPFVTLNAASLLENEIDYELFGGEEHLGIHGTTHKLGLLERANGGTLFINNVEELPLTAQGKLLRVLQEQGFDHPGTGLPVKVDIRVVSASSCDLKQAMAEGRLREDMFYRLNVVSLSIPPLAEHKEDIPLLCNYFLPRSAKMLGLPVRTLKEEALALMQSYHWPGNIRQLKNVIEWLLIMAPEGEEAIDPHILPPEISLTHPVGNTSSTMGADIMALPLRDAREMFERQYLVAQLGRFGGNISRTSGFIGMERSALHRKLKSLGVSCLENA